MFEYLVIVGEVFDVRAGPSYYGKGGSYSFFTGGDGSRAFVSGDFTETGLTGEPHSTRARDKRLARASRYRDESKHPG